MAGLKLTIISNLIVLFILVKLNHQNSSLQLHEINGKIKHKSNFSILCSIYGYKKFPQNQRIKRLLLALENSYTFSDVYFFISQSTEIINNFENQFNLNVHVEYINCSFTKEDAEKLYNFQGSFWSWIFTYRYKFYQDFIESHPNIEYLIILDDDTLILKDLTTIFESDPNSVHLMNDYYNFSVTEDLNFIWTDVVDSVNETIKHKCGLNQLIAPIRSQEFFANIPLNSGLLFGKTENLLKLVKFMTEKGICIGVLPKICDQGLINYLYYSRAFDEQNISIHQHSMYEHLLISCPEQFLKNEYNQSIAENWHVIHHYESFKKDASNLPIQIQSYIKF